MALVLQGEDVGFACSLWGARPCLASVQGRDARPELQEGYAVILGGLGRRKERGSLTWGCPARHTAAGASRPPAGTGDAARSLLSVCLQKEERKSWGTVCPCPTLCRSLHAPQNPALLPKKPSPSSASAPVGGRVHWDGGRALGAAPASLSTAPSPSPRGPVPSAPRGTYSGPAASAWSTSRRSAGTRGPRCRSPRLRCPPW